MKKIVKLVNELKVVGLLEQSELLKDSINGIGEILGQIEDNIGKEIILKVQEKKFDEVSKLAEIPNICKEYRDYITSILENPNLDLDEVDLKSNDNARVEYDSETNINDDLDVESISATDNSPEVYFKIGEKIEHTSLGEGVISKIETKDGSGNKILILTFPSGVQKIECTPENLEKYFGVIKEIDNKSHKEVYKRIKNFNNGLNLYTSPEYFTHRKPVMVEIFGHQYRATNWRDVAYCMLNVYYKKYPETVSKALKESGNFSLKGKDLSVPYSLSGNKNGPFFEAAKSAMEMIKMLSFVGEYLTPVLGKDVCKNTLIYLKRKD